MIGKKEILAVVKSNAYGHGILEISNALYSQGVNWFGVGNPENGKYLRESGFEGKILAMGSLLPNQVVTCVDYGIDISISSEDQLDSICLLAKMHKKQAFVQLCLDTGMSRNGFTFGDNLGIDSTLQKVRELDYVNLRGIWTHFANSDDPESGHSSDQLEIFSSFVERFSDEGLTNLMVHHSNTGGVVRKLGGFDNLVRPGLFLYGYLPSKRMEDSIQDALKPVMSLHSIVSLVKNVPAGSGISYGHDFTTERETRIGILPIGYFHGLPLSGSGKISVGVRGRRYKVLGKICMDQTIIDLEDNYDIIPGDEVCLFGDGSMGEPTLEEWAKDSNTTVYDILTSINSSIMREYIT